MARKVEHENRIESISGRARLKRGRQPHWQALAGLGGKVHLGWQCWKGEAAGRWILRRYIGLSTSKTGKPVAKYSTMTLGLADDAQEANGHSILSYDQAAAAAHTKVKTSSGNGKVERMTVRQALARYIDYLRNQGKSAADVMSRGTAHILPVLGDLVIAELTTEQLQRWLATMAAAPAQTRPCNGKPQYRSAPNSDEGIRARRSTANRVLTMLKAALNHAYDEGHTENRDPWGRKLKPFRNVDVARVRYLSVADAERLLNACDPDFRPLVQAALETGCRYSELTRLTVANFHLAQQRNSRGESIEVGTIAIQQSKTGKSRYVTLTPHGATFFRQHCLGRGGHELMFKHGDREWRTAEQKRPMERACERAKITPRISFHGLRHTWASLAVMNGVPLMVVAKNLGHIDTRMVEKHYGHLAPSFIIDAIHAGAPRFAVADDTTVVPLRKGS